MIKYLLKKLRPKRGVIVAFFIVLMIITGVGYFFATKKSEPVYLSKIDKLMFDTKNKAPRYVLTMPEKKIHPDKLKLMGQPVEEPAKEKTVAKEEKKEPQKEFDPTEFLNNIPLISKLSNAEGHLPLKYVEIGSSLSETENSLTLPKVAYNNKKPWTEYGNLVEVMPNFNRISIVIKDLGLDDATTDAAINAFPSEVSLSFSPYAKTPKVKLLEARQKGHETYVDMLLSSKDFLRSDTGPLAMSMTVSQEELLSRLQQTMSVGAPIGGMIVAPGIVDEYNKDRLAVLLKEVQKRGLLMADATGEEGLDKIETSALPRKKAEILLGKVLDKTEIEKELRTAETIARDNGSVLIVAEPKPVVLIAIKEWIATFSPQIPYEKSKNIVIEKPFALVPLSNVVVE